MPGILPSDGALSDEVCTIVHDFASPVFVLRFVFRTIHGSRRAAKMEKAWEHWSTRNLVNVWVIIVHYFMNLNMTPPPCIRLTSTLHSPVVIHLINIPRPSVYILNANQRTKKGEALERGCQ